jgi:uncharacterized protein
MRNPYDAIGRIGLLLAIVGAVNWLLVGLFEWNLVAWIFTESGTQTVSTLGERIVYIAVGVGGLLAIPMLAATLARSRSRSVSDEGRERSDRYVESDDTAYYLGASKSERESSREERPSRVAEPEPLRAQESRASGEESTPVRKTERVIIRTEEPISVPQDEASVSSTGSSRSEADESLRYGTVEETDEGLAEDQEERRRAA